MSSKSNNPDIQRCPWCLKDELYQKYHDEEWGFPVHDDRKHFEFLLLETMQAGLSWHTILKKRENFRKAFDHFDPVKISRYKDEKLDKLMSDAGIIRNRQKLSAAITNAAAFLEVQQGFGSFDAWIWSFVKSKPVVNHWKSLSEIPAATPLSDTISREMKKRGFKFVGSTTIYAHLQAIGVVDDHLVSCFRRQK